MYLTESEDTLQVINKWIRGGAKLNLDKTADADVLKDIVIKLQKRVKAGMATLLIKVKAHRGDPLNEEEDIRAEMGRMEETGDVTGCDRKQVKYRTSEHLNEERKNGVRNTSHKRERINEDGSFMPHQKGPITSTYTTDRLVPPGGGRQGETRGMDEVDLGKTSGPKKNVVRYVT